MTFYTFSDLELHNATCMWALAENCLQIGKESYQVLDLSASYILYTRITQKKTPSWFATTLKILFYSTIILPLIAFLICGWCRMGRIYMYVPNSDAAKRVSDLYLRPVKG